MLILTFIIFGFIMIKMIQQIYDIEDNIEYVIQIVLVLIYIWCYFWVISQLLKM
jgi:hypothetical protein